MKRIALLLAGAVLGTGCIIDTTDTCDRRELQIDWSFVGVNGVGGRSCTSLDLSDDIAEVDVYIDGSFVSTSSCLDYGVSYFDYPSGTHDILLEGYNAGGTLITRNVRSVYVDSCGITNTLIEPGEAILEVTPDACVAGGYLWYSLSDTTFSPSTPVASVGTGITLPCAGGITVGPVPYGYYQFDWIEEVDGSQTLLDWGTCTDPEHAVFSWASAAFTVDLYSNASCP
jgi:hypothetical protein